MVNGVKAGVGILQGLVRCRFEIFVRRPVETMTCVRYWKHLRGLT